jgi:hypothetical protein
MSRIDRFSQGFVRAVIANAGGDGAGELPAGPRTTLTPGRQSPKVASRRVLPGGILPSSRREMVPSVVD